jgi:hypothetical protein
MLPKDARRIDIPRSMRRRWRRGEAGGRVAWLSRASTLTSTLAGQTRLRFTRAWNPSCCSVKVVASPSNHLDLMNRLVDLAARTSSSLGGDGGTPCASGSHLMGGYFSSATLSYLGHI